MIGIDKGIRFTNYLMDLSIIIIGWIGVSILIQDSYLDISSYYIISFFYYFLLEVVLGQTVGKMATKTKVIRKNGRKPTVIHILIRSLLRLIPIDGLSYVFGTEQGFHDILSSTRLVKL